MTIAEDFISWAWSLELDTVPEAVRESAALHVLDGLGTALAARRLGVIDYAVDVGRSGGGPPEATILGDLQGVAAPWAAFANGVLLHALDYDDTHTEGLVHSTAVTLPAALAAGEAQHRSGAEMLLAMVAGYELVARLAQAAPHGFHARGFHATSVCGTFAAALVASRLGGLTERAAVAALGIAGSQAAGSLEFLSTGSSTKQLHPGWASMAGIVAARLGGAGATGPSSIIEGDRGLYRLFTDMETKPTKVVTGLGSHWETERIAIKPYPACHLLQKTLDATASLGSVDVENVSEVVVRVPADSVPIVCEPVRAKREPRSSYEAKFSMQWAVAAMMVDGSVDIATFEESQLVRPELLDLTRRVRYEVHEYAGPAADAPGDVRVMLVDGTTQVGRAAPGPRRTRSMRAAVLDKFHANAGGDEAARQRLADSVLDLPCCRDVAELPRLAAALAGSWTVSSE